MVEIPIIWQEGLAESRLHTAHRQSGARYRVPCRGLFIAMDPNSAQRHKAGTYIACRGPKEGDRNGVTVKEPPVPCLMTVGTESCN